MLRLPDVTLIAIDAVAHDLTRLAIEDTLERVEPAAIITWSDRPLTTRSGSYNVLARPESWIEVARLLWYDVPTRVTTSHFLLVQWDSWVLNEAYWDPRWLDLDYLGAPWGWHGDGLEVGNGGFTLRSTRLARWVARHERYSVSHPEDVALCRVHRHALEADGFRWASVEEAERFAFERAAPRLAFGFHGAWNFPSVLNRDRLLQRLELANDYVRDKVEWKELMTNARPVLRSAPSSSPPTRTLPSSTPFSAPPASPTS